MGASGQYWRTHVVLPYLVPTDSLLFQLLKLPFQLCLAFYFLLCSTNKHHFPIDVLSIHLFHCLDRESNRKFLSIAEAKQQLSLLPSLITDSPILLPWLWTKAAKLTIFHLCYFYKKVQEETNQSYWQGLYGGYPQFWPKRSDT